MQNTEQLTLWTGASTRPHRLTATLFAATLLAFLLPFATVSCASQVTFTGFDLVTATVGGDDADLAAAIEGDGTFLAALAALAALVGGALAVVGRRGQGAAAVTALGALLLLPWIATFDFADFKVRSGYVIATSTLAAAVVVRARDLVLRRRADGRGSAGALVALVTYAIFALLTAALCVDASTSYAG